MKTFKIGIFGASGFAREVADISLDLGFKKIVFIDFKPNENSYFGFDLISEKDISLLIKEGFCFAMGIGDNRLRKKVYEKFKRLIFPNIIHPTVTMGFNQFDQIQNKKGNIIAAGVRFTNNIQMGNFGIFNLNCTIGHDCTINDYINIAPGSNISGNVDIGEGVYIGTNVSILQGKYIDKKIVVGEYSTIGAGAVVTENILPHSIAVGIPAKSR